MEDREKRAMKFLENLVILLVRILKAWPVQWQREWRRKNYTRVLGDQMDRLTNCYIWGSNRRENQRWFRGFKFKWWDRCWWSKHKQGMQEQELVWKLGLGESWVVMLNSIAHVLSLRYWNGAGLYGPCPPCPLPAFCPWKNFSQRISLIREVRTCRNKGKQSKETK